MDIQIFDENALDKSQVLDHADKTVESGLDKSKALDRAGKTAENSATMLRAVMTVGAAMVAPIAPIGVSLIVFSVVSSAVLKQFAKHHRFTHLLNETRDSLNCLCANSIFIEILNCTSPSLIEIKIQKQLSVFLTFFSNVQTISSWWRRVMASGRLASELCDNLIVLNLLLNIELFDLLSRKLDHQKSEHDALVARVYKLENPGASSETPKLDAKPVEPDTTVKTGKQIDTIRVFLDNTLSNKDQNQTDIAYNDFKKNNPELAEKVEEFRKNCQDISKSVDISLRKENGAKSSVNFLRSVREHIGKKTPTFKTSPWRSLHFTRKKSHAKGVESKRNSSSNIKKTMIADQPS